MRIWQARQPFMVTLMIPFQISMHAFNKRSFYRSVIISVNRKSAKMNDIAVSYLPNKATHIPINYSQIN